MPGYLYIMAGRYSWIRCTFYIACLTHWGGIEVANGIYWGGSFEALQDAVKLEMIKHEDIRLFVGYSGWSAGQLENELRENSWIIADSTEELLFDIEPASVWKDAINNLDDEYKYLANLPVDPQLN